MDLSKPAKLGKLEKSQLKWFRSLPEDTQYGIVFMGLIWVHPKDIRERLDA